MGSFNFTKAKQEALKDLTNNKLGALILGQSGAGKSSVAGTFNCKTLYLYTTGESHGAKAAGSLGGTNVFPVCLDYVDGVAVGPDAAYQRLLDILSDVDGIKSQKFGAIVLDGATELEVLIRATNKWRIRCQTDKGKHNNFAEGPATLALFRPVIDGLKDLQRKLGVHFAVTCVLDVQALADNGEVLESKPRLSTYAVAEGIVQQHEDIVVVGRMTNPQGEIAHRLQFLAGVTRESKDAAGVVKKSINFNPRLAGLGVHKLPQTLPADLNQLAALKAGGSTDAQAEAV